jgi:hypothetical protein
MTKWLRKMRQEVLHEGCIPTEDEKELATSATVNLLKELKKVYDAEKVTENNSIATHKK